MSRSLKADEIVALLGLEAHPEGGCFVETYRQRSLPGQRSESTAIYYLLREGEVSHWHRIDAVEVWHHYAGAALELSVSSQPGQVDTLLLGSDLQAGQRPQRVVEPGEWQAARSLGAWSLVGCTVAPGFEFEGFEMAAPGWSP